MERWEIVYRGRVQGVGFRATTRGIARGYRVTGWVRNEPDGRVRVQVQGAREEVEAFMRELEERMAGNIRGREAWRAMEVDGEDAFEVVR